MKTLKWIADTEVSNVSMIKFVGNFDMDCNATNCLTVRCFDSDNAKIIFDKFIDDCDSKYKDCLRNNLTFGKLSETGNIDFVLSIDSNFYFDISFKQGYTVVSIVVIKEFMRIG